jgi:ATP-dependent RNA helicase DeaD
MIKFERMGFTPGILMALKDLGFEQPTPVQEKVIPAILEYDNDIIALAQTGTGKTAAFGLPLVMATDTKVNHPKTLILCPTRELCIQISGDLEDYAKYTGNLRILPIYGGTSITDQITELKKGVHIIVATPGRLIDMIGRKAVKLANVNTVILDEADEMLNMGFLEDINEILKEVPRSKRTLLFSATMSPAVATIAKNYMHDPIEITLGAKNSSAENVSHGFYLVHARDKYKVLKRIADSEPEIYGIVFCRTRRETQEIALKLINDGYNAEALHGDLSQSQRDAVMHKFRSRNLRLLVATDIAARGLDVDDLTHVINFNLPDDNEVYTHRCGRTGRAGKNGKSISLVHLKEKQNLQKIEKQLRKPFKALSIPTGNEICGNQLSHWVKKLENTSTGHIVIERFLPEIKKQLERIDKEELIRRVVSLEFDRFLQDYHNGEELVAPVQEKNISRGSEYRNGTNEDTGNFTRLFINLGKSDGFYPDQLISLLNSNTKGRKIPIGKIDLLKTFSFFEVESRYVKNLISTLNNQEFMGKRVALELAQGKASNNLNSRNQGSKNDKWHNGRNRGKKVKEKHRTLVENDYFPLRNS